MKWMLVLLAVFATVSCAPSREARLAGAEQRVAAVNGQSLSGSAGGVGPGSVAVRYTLLDLDADAASRLGFTDGPSDIKPRRFTEPRGDLVAVAIMEQEIGEVIDRGEWTAREDEPQKVKSSRRVVYLRDWTDGDTDPERAKQGPFPALDTIENGFHGTMTIRRIGSEFAVNLESESMHLLQPVPKFVTTLGTGNEVFIDIPHVSAVSRVAVENVIPGETAMFQLSRAGDRQGRVRLLFLRVLTSE